ncbi:hypothetical protein [Rhodococcoides fascians]|uniref:hypothetical protein n=1 Tax=Rhodococcoides fascians TaxID=1828 RepID=UPI00050CDE74|nr:hypothetical protein [Rhodococcus fascians]
MQYNPAGSNFDRVLTDSAPLKRVLRRKAQAGATFWTMNSIIRTGFNASSVRVLEGRGSGDLADRDVAVIYTHGYYAKWREIGTRWNRPERVLRRSTDAIREA